MFCFCSDTAGVELPQTGTMHTMLLDKVIDQSNLKKTTTKLHWVSGLTVIYPKIKARTKLKYGLFNTSNPSNALQ